MFILCKHVAILMDTMSSAGAPPPPPPPSSEEQRGRRREGECRRLSDHFAPLNLSILPCFSHPPSLLIFPSSFTQGLLMHVIAKLAAVGGYRGILTPKMLPHHHLPLHHHISPLLSIVTGWLCSLSWKNSLISRADFKQV